MADFKAGDILKKNELILVAKELSEEMLVEGKAKAEVKAVVLWAMTERNILKGTVKTVEMSEIQFQLKMKKVEIQERE